MEGQEEAMEPASEQQAQGLMVQELIWTLVSISMDSFQSFQLVLTQDKSGKWITSPTHVSVLD